MPSGRGVAPRTADGTQGNVPQLPSLDTRTILNRNVAVDTTADAHCVSRLVASQFMIALNAPRSISTKRSNAEPGLHRLTAQCILAMRSKYIGCRSTKLKREVIAQPLTAAYRCSGGRDRACAPLSRRCRCSRSHLGQHIRLTAPMRCPTESRGSRCSSPEDALCRSTVRLAAADGRNHR